MKRSIALLLALLLTAGLLCGCGSTSGSAEPAAAPSSAEASAEEAPVQAPEAAAAPEEPEEAVSAEGIHGTNERISVRAYLQGIRVLTRLMETTCMNPEEME